jgi:hypothetical protein
MLEIGVSAPRSPLTMVYAHPKQGRPVCFFGVYCRILSGPSLPIPFRRENPGSSPLDDAVFFS